MQKTGKANIAVGYFFISGFSVIIQPIQNVDKIRLLISNAIDYKTVEALIEMCYNIREVYTEIDKKNYANEDRKAKSNKI